MHLTSLAATLACLLAIDASAVAAQTVELISADKEETVHQFEHGPPDDFDFYRYLQGPGGLKVISLAQNLYADHPDRRVTRVFIEFSIPNVAGRLTGALILAKYKDVSAGRPFQIAAYLPDHYLDQADFDKADVPFAFFTTADPAVDEEAVSIPLPSNILAAHRGQKLGLRLSLVDEGALGEQFESGAEFEDSSIGVGPELLLATCAPAQTLIHLADLVTSVVKDQGVARTLRILLKAAEKLANGNLVYGRAASGMVTAFINKVEAQRGRKIDGATADQLLTLAHGVRACLPATAP